MNSSYSKKNNLIFVIQVALLALFISCGKEDDKVDPPASPLLTDFSPKSVLPGDTITISGENFGSEMAAADVSLGDIDISVASVTDSEIKFVIPENATTGALTASVGDVTKAFSEPVTVLSLYFVGEETVNGTARLKYWKNGDSFDVATGSIAESAVALDVENGDVYVAGDGRLGISRTAKYWVNGEGHDLTDGTFTARAKAIKVAGSDIYVAGYEASNGFVATLWKNGEVIFESNGTTSSILYDVEVFQNSVYAAGHEGLKATYWKDGVAVHLSDGEVQARIDDIKITEAGVFAVGWEGDLAMYWEGNTGIALETVTATPDWSRAASIVVDGEDIYICGTEATTADMSMAVLWKNGDPVALSSSGRRSGAHSLSVLNGNVYCAGFEFDASGNYATGTYWKNGTMETITQTGGYGVLNAMVIAE